MASNLSIFFSFPFIGSYIVCWCRNLTEIYFSFSGLIPISVSDKIIALIIVTMDTMKILPSTKQY